ncbi:CDGSH iron-sulfur domain-containing protein [Actinospica sp.]|uniref:CDGSH iron-sulfur domain-containing protein n=1 Tax=Actinospica sp. TaxID=1872142 RepID=UPI002C94099E|nr:CDGSH iron-sulfur domain-containing protein [Actinospica sp.]HWG24534.1 CDGSH iron-sulfur domain-containing protein [Actinospica sp.]
MAHETENDIKHARVRESLLAAGSLLASRLQPHEDERLEEIGTRLRDSVLRPLGQTAAAQPPQAAVGGGDLPASAEVDAELWRLAGMATRLRVRAVHDAALAEATAALQGLALSLADETVATQRLAELEALQSGLAAGIQVAANGPYLVTNARRVLDGLGVPIATTPQTALCRCGRSGHKPFCDGAHARTGFTDAKDPDRVPDRRDTYVGQQVTVLDNRGICQHAGYCTDRLDTVFHSGSEPFVTPSGGRMDEIIRAVRDCPSGALSYAVDGHEARQETDHHGTREPTITVTADGPYRITGAIELTGHDGEDHPRAEGASREHYALCRCGHSQNKPFCSGAHYYVEFRDPVPDADHEPSIFEWAGGLPALVRMTRLFYEKHVPQDPLLAPLFATMSADHPERVAAWLAEVFCGPKSYSSEYGGYPRMLSQHVGKHLTEEQRARWVALIQQSAREAGLPNDAEFRSAFGAYIEWGSRLAVENSQTESKPPQNMPMPHWDWQTAAGAPGSRISALAPHTDGDREGAGEESGPDEPVLPAPAEAVRFEQHIKPLFRRFDRQSMRGAFDLWAHDDVSRHADAIAQRVRAGTMPCDGAWPAEYVETFQRWIDEGKQP